MSLVVCCTFEKARDLVYQIRNLQEMAANQSFFFKWNNFQTENFRVTFWNPNKIRIFGLQAHHWTSLNDKWLLIGRLSI